MVFEVIYLVQILTMQRREGSLRQFSFLRCNNISAKTQEINVFYVAFICLLVSRNTRDLLCEFWDPLSLWAVQITDSEYTECVCSVKTVWSIPQRFRGELLTMGRIQIYAPVPLRTGKKH